MIFAHMAGQIQLDQFSNPRCSSQWRGLFGGFAAAALVLLPANNMVKLWRIFLFFFFFFFPSLFFFILPGRWAAAGSGRALEPVYPHRNADCLRSPCRPPRLLSAIQSG